MSSRAFFAQAYRGHPAWRIDGPQPAIVDLARAGRIRSPVLDLGCGTGETATWLATRGIAVVGIDQDPGAIAAARRLARQHRAPARFVVADALHHRERGVATVLDVGFFHGLPDEDRPAYAAAVARALQPGGRLHLLTFAPGAPVHGRA